MKDHICIDHLERNVEIGFFDGKVSICKSDVCKRCGVVVRQVERTAPGSSFMFASTGAVANPWYGFMSQPICPKCKAGRLVPGKLFTPSASKPATEFITRSCDNPLCEDYEDGFDAYSVAR